MHSFPSVHRALKLLLPTATALLTSFAYGGSPLVINEVMANNRSAYPHGMGFPQWVELYNRGIDPVPLAGVVVSNPTRGANYRIPDSTPALLPRRFRTLYFDTSGPAGELHVGFTLNSAGDQLALMAPTGETLDSVEFGIQASDLSIGRNPDGEVSNPWVLCHSTPGASNHPATLGASAKLHINEWMAKALSGDDWLELFNESTSPISLEGLVLSDQKTIPSTNHPIHALSFLAPEGFLQFLASGTVTPLSTHLDFKLSAKGATIHLYDADRTKLIDKVKFGTQLVGVSEGMLPDGGTNVIVFPSGRSTPGLSNFQLLRSVYINELLSHTDPPIEDAVELYNPTATVVNIGGWLMSNQRGTPARYAFPSDTILQPHAFHVVYESQFRNSNPLYPNFTFNSAHGDHCLLTTADSAGNLTGEQLEVMVGSAAHGVSFGRVETSTGVDFEAMERITFGVDAPVSVTAFEVGMGRTNSPPRIGPLVVSEIMYRPVDLGTNDPALDQYIELQNITGAAVQLFDLVTYVTVPSATTNSYSLRGAVSFQFPPALTLLAEESVLVAPFDPAAQTAQLSHFRQRYGVPAGVRILGPWKGSLGDSGTVELYKPDIIQEPPHPDAGYIPMVLVERVTYSDSNGWPESARGTGMALQRLRLDGYGNDVRNWTASLASPGLPAAPASLNAELLRGANVVVSFEAAAGLSYEIQQRPGLPSGPNPAPWRTITPTWPAVAWTRTISITNAISATAPIMLYRISTP